MKPTTQAKAKCKTCKWKHTCSKPKDCGMYERDLMVLEEQLISKRQAIAMLRKDIAMNDLPLDGDYNKGILHAIDLIQSMDAEEGE